MFNGSIRHLPMILNMCILDSSINIKDYYAEYEL